MIDFTVFEKKKINKKDTETLPSSNQHCIEKKKKYSPEIEQRLLL